MEKPTRKTILALAGLALMTLVFGFVLLLGRAERRGSRCTGFNVEVRDSSEHRFVTAADVRAYLAEEIGTVEGRVLDSLDLADIEHRLNRGVGILRSEVWKTPDGQLHASIDQRIPVVRFQGLQGGYYCDAEGYILPLNANAIRVQTVDGALGYMPAAGFSGFPEDGPGKEWLQRMLGLVATIRRSPTWSGNIAQIHVEEGSGELTLILRDRPERFLFGQPENAGAKLARMDQYFRKVLPQLPEGAAYKSVNVKYKGQIICRNK